jgi:hypothetical protein
MQNTMLPIEMSGGFDNEEDQREYEAAVGYFMMALLHHAAFVDVCGACDDDDLSVPPGITRH